MDQEISRGKGLSREPRRGVVHEMSLRFYVQNKRRFKGRLFLFTHNVPVCSILIRDRSIGEGWNYKNMFSRV